MGKSCQTVFGLAFQRDFKEAMMIVLEMIQ